MVRAAPCRPGSGSPWRSSQCIGTMCEPKWLAKTITPLPRPERRIEMFAADHREQAGASRRSERPSSTRSRTCQRTSLPARVRDSAGRSQRHPKWFDQRRTASSWRTRLAGDTRARPARSRPARAAARGRAAQGGQQDPDQPLAEFQPPPHHHVRPFSHPCSPGRHPTRSLGSVRRPSRPAARFGIPDQTMPLDARRDITDTVQAGELGLFQVHAERSPPPRRRRRRGRASRSGDPRPAGCRR